MAMSLLPKAIGAFPVPSLISSVIWSLPQKKVSMVPTTFWSSSIPDQKPFVEVCEPMARVQRHDVAGQKAVIGCS
jgi:hypothetical protein